MTGPKLSKLELQIMETLWTRGESSIREIQESFPEKTRPGYTTIQNDHLPKEIRQGRPPHPHGVGNFHIFRTSHLPRDAAQLRLIDELIAVRRPPPARRHAPRQTAGPNSAWKMSAAAERELKKLERKDKQP